MESIIQTGENVGGTEPLGEHSVKMVKYPFMLESEIRALATEKVGQTCADGGRCHHHCTQSCSRKIGCVPFSDSGLDDHWNPLPSEADKAKLEALIISAEIEMLNPTLAIQEQPASIKRMKL